MSENLFVFAMIRVLVLSEVEIGLYILWKEKSGILNRVLSFKLYLHVVHSVMTDFPLALPFFFKPGVNIQRPNLKL